MAVWHMRRLRHEGVTVVPGARPPEVLGALRHDGDGALAVPGLHAIKRSAFATPRFQLDPYDGARLRREARYLPSMALVHAHGAEGGDASVAEQLQWYPGLCHTLGAFGRYS